MLKYLNTQVTFSEIPDEITLCINITGCKVGCEGCNYFTFNIPISECRDCNHIVNAPIKECPKCGSHNIKYYTRIISYLTAVDNWSIERQEEFKHRKYYH